MALAVDALEAPLKKAPEYTYAAVTVLKTNGGPIAPLVRFVCHGSYTQDDKFGAVIAVEQILDRAITTVATEDLRTVDSLPDSYAYTETYFSEGARTDFAERTAYFDCKPLKEKARIELLRRLG